MTQQMTIFHLNFSFKPNLKPDPEIQF